MLLYQLYPISFIFHRFGLNTIWVNILTASIRAFLVPNKPKRHFVWWGLYFICSDLWAFEHNYMEAWSQRSTNGAHLFVDDHYLRIPLPDNADDAETLIHLRMYYHLICARGSVSELLYIKQLERVDRVEVNNEILGTKIETIDLGRSGGRLVGNFQTPERLAGQHELTDRLQANATTEGVEFVRSWDSEVIAKLVFTPFLVSLLFAAVWVGVFVKRGEGLQTTMQTAFTVASYVVTAGALIIALVAYLEQVRQLAYRQ